MRTEYRVMCAHKTLVLENPPYWGVRTVIRKMKQNMKNISSRVGHALQTEYRDTHVTQDNTNKA